MKLNEIKNVKDDDKPFNYQEWAGVHVRKVLFKQDIFSGGKMGNFHYLSKEQRAACKKLEDEGWVEINGYEAGGREFPDPKDNHKSTFFYKDIVIMAKDKEPGAMAVLPSGKTKKVSSKSWKPAVADFKELTESTLEEGMYVVKSKDGVEKRFKSADSEEAVAWKNTTAKKVKETAPTYSQEWWEAKEDKDMDALMPWDRIDVGGTKGELKMDDVEKLVKETFGDVQHDITDGSPKRGTRVVKGVTCASISFRVMVLHTKEDDIGVEDDDGVEESYWFTFVRDPKNPAKFNGGMYS